MTPDALAAWHAPQDLCVDFERPGVRVVAEG
jgi:hypothetical protein